MGQFPIKGPNTPPPINVQNFAQNLGGRGGPPRHKCAKIHKGGPNFLHI